MQSPVLLSRRQSGPSAEPHHYMAIPSQEPEVDRKLERLLEHRRSSDAAAIGRLLNRQRSWESRRSSFDRSAECRRSATSQLLESVESTRTPEPKTCQDHGQQLLESMPFQVMMALVILANAMVIGLETEMPDGLCWDSVENLFLIIFTAELVLRFAVLGNARMWDLESSDFSWNLFDVVVVALGIVDVIASVLVGSSTGSVATLFRIVRLLRILRVFRIVRFLKQLYLLAFGLADAAQAVFWVTILMTFVLYVCGIILVRTVGSVGEADPHYDFLQQHFGGIPRAMLTLFELMSAPNLPEYQAQGSLLYDRPFMTIFLIGFVIFGSFGMIALLTGVISESMFEKNQLRMDEERAERELTQKAIQDQCEYLFDTVEGQTQTTDEVPAEAVQALIPKIMATFEALHIDFLKSDLEGIIECMDMDDSGLISKEEFCTGVLSLASAQGGVRSISMQKVLHTVSIQSRKISRIEELLKRLTRLVEGKEAPATSNAQRAQEPSAAEQLARSGAGVKQASEWPETALGHPGLSQASLGAVEKTLGEVVLLQRQMLQQQKAAAEPAALGEMVALQRQMLQQQQKAAAVTAAESAQSAAEFSEILREVRALARERPQAGHAEASLEASVSQLNMRVRELADVQHDLMASKAIGASEARWGFSRVPDLGMAGAVHLKGPPPGRPLSLESEVEAQAMFSRTAHKVLGGQQFANEVFERVVIAAQTGATALVSGVIAEAKASLVDYMEQTRLLAEAWPSSDPATHAGECGGVLMTSSLTS